MGAWPEHTDSQARDVGADRGSSRGGMSTRFTISASGIPEPDGGPVRLLAGAVDAVSPSIGDIHRVCNAVDDHPSVSIHVYGTNVGRLSRTAFGSDGTATASVSGYS